MHARHVLARSGLGVAELESSPRDSQCDSSSAGRKAELAGCWATAERFGDLCFGQAEPVAENDNRALVVRETSERVVEFAFLLGE